MHKDSEARPLQRKPKRRKLQKIGSKVLPTERSSKKEHYNNCTMLGPEGDEMCKIALKRANWYLCRNLASVVQEDPLVIKLSFEPNGKGCAGDLFYLAERKNQCVVCGATKNLTRHHCVPFCFRKYFPSEYKENTSHDVLLVCAPCHEEYEKIAQPIKNSLLTRAGVRLGSGSEYDVLRSARRAAATLYHHGNRVPPEREHMLREQIGAIYGFPVTDDMILQVCIEEENGLGAHGSEPMEPWRAVVEREPDLHAFIRSWRGHFVGVMSPLYLPEYWSIEGRYQK